MSQSSHEVTTMGAAASSTSGTVPPAALYILVFDQNHNPIGTPIIQSITEAAQVTQENPDQPHETLSFTLPIDQPGYVYIYSGMKALQPYILMICWWSISMAV